jgi:osmotically-inducible protein OsmY
MMPLFAKSGFGASLGAILGALACWSASVGANKDTPDARSLDTIVVTAKKLAQDEALTKQVEAALLSNPYFIGEHIAVTVKNGVVNLEGVVFDDWDIRIAKRISQRVPGVRRVSTAGLDIHDGT